MVGERTLPGLGLSAYWTAGSNGWNAQHDPDTRLLSILCQCRALSRTTALPGSPSDGDIYIVPSGAGSNANEIAARDNGAWVYIVPAEGYLVWVEDTNEYYKWTGAAWETMLPNPILTINAQTASYELVLADKNKLIRMNSASAMALTVPANATVAFEIGTVIHLRQVSTGQVTVGGAGGVTINSPETTKLRKGGASAALTKVGTNEWDLTGDLEALP